MEHETISPIQFARARGLTRKYVYDLLAEGRLAGAKKLGRNWAIPRVLLEISTSINTNEQPLKDGRLPGDSRETPGKSSERLS
jgi:hypothetical protein